MWLRLSDSIDSVARCWRMTLASSLRKRWKSWSRAWGRRMSAESTSPERSAVLILRVLLDGSLDDGLQARLTRSLDISTSEHQVTTATTVDEVCDGVRSWLEAFVLNDGSLGGDAPATAAKTATSWRPRRLSQRSASGREFR